MKFISDLLLGVLKSVAIAIILSTIALSLMQKKFPPSFTEANSLFESANKLIQMSASLNTDTHNAEAILNKEQLITSRDKLLKEVERIDTTTQEPAKPLKTAKEITDTSNRDLAMFKIRLEQSEYKIRLLEYEMKQLKNEYKKLTH